MTAAFHPARTFPDPARTLLSAWTLCAAIGLAACSEAPAPLTPAAVVDAHATIAPDRIASASTRPVLEAAPPTTTAHTARPRDLTLLGTTVGARDAFAVVRRDGSPQSFQLRVGDTVDGRVVTAIEFDRIVLASNPARGDNAAATVHLDIAAAAPSPAEPTAKAPTAGAATPAPVYTEPEIVVAGH